MGALKVVFKELCGDSLYLKIKKETDMTGSLCSFIFDLGVASDDFDRQYEDTIDEMIYNENKEFKIHLISSKDFVHLIIISKWGGKESRLKVEEKLKLYSIISK